MAREMASRARISSCLTQETNDWPQDDTCETCSLSSRNRFISTVVQILGQRLAMSSPCQPLNPTRQNFALLKISKLIVLWNEKISPCSSLTPLNPSTHQEAGFTPKERTWFCVWRWHRYCLLSAWKLWSSNTQYWIRLLESPRSLEQAAPGIWLAVAPIEEPFPESKLPPKILAQLPMIITLFWVW